ncbi:substrate-binding domain-containing protein [candidate division FCPU426 bacterium]|nr:substrate-binding domain-containing protein [candidate division FCPU426 bacterium]
MRKSCWLLLLLGAMLAWGCGQPKPRLTVFYAPCFSPVLEALKAELNQAQGVRLAGEVGGSQALCRKVADLGRECDLLLLSDARLFKEMLAPYISWRLEFVHDEVVLGVGVRARRVDEAERDWLAVLQDPDIVLGRVDECLGPIGYRTLLVWRFLELAGHASVSQMLLDNTDKILDHADHLAAFLKNGDVEYGFLYRTTCMQYDIRFIPLSPEINMGAEGQDYSRAEVKYQQKNGKTVAVAGSRITYGLSVPTNAPQPEKAKAAALWLLSGHGQLFRDKGYVYYKPKFYGPRAEYGYFSAIADYAGEF